VRVPELTVRIVRFVDDSFPGWVECTLTDAEGREWTFHDKVPMFTCEQLSAASSYPQPGVVGCQIVQRSRDAAGREIVTVDTRLPWDCRATDGTYQFDVLAEQVIDSPPAV
jgi:hypothetical protein